MHLTLTTINSCYQCLRSKSTNFKIFDSNIVELEVLFESFKMERILSALNIVNKNYGWSCTQNKVFNTGKRKLFVKVKYFFENLSFHLVLT